MSPHVETFDPTTASEADLESWSAAFCRGRAELSGGAPLPEEFAARLRTNRAGRAWRWAARDDAEGSVTGVAELRRQHHDPGIGFMRLFVADAARRRGAGRELREAVVERARLLGMERLRSLVSAGPPGESFARASPYLRTLLRLERVRRRSPCCPPSVG
ncbi:GNAT family N-acetyltransferase [Nocardiopsis alba]|uniref:GNAT family N-acetyltransferase n=1 Tax=Nocardiopsis alba TaxID=53437 RepID=UPI0035DC6C77